MQRTGAPSGTGWSTLRRARSDSASTCCTPSAASRPSGTTFDTGRATRLRSWSPTVVVVGPGHQELALRLSARVPGVMTGSRMRAEVLRRADTVVAGSEYERGLLTRGLGIDPGQVSVIGNGAYPQPNEDVLPEGTRWRLCTDGRRRVAPEGPRGGAARSRRETAGRCGGGLCGAASGLAAWERVVKETNSVWLGPVADPRQLGALQRSALAFVHLSSAEVQSLAVLEALARGTPTVLSDIPSHRELAEAHPSLVRIVADPSELPGALEQFPSGRPRKPAPVPTWREVAERLTAVYRRVAG